MKEKKIPIAYKVFHNYLLEKSKFRLLEVKKARGFLTAYKFRMPKHKVNSILSEMHAYKLIELHHNHNRDIRIMGEKFVL